MLKEPCIFAVENGHFIDNESWNFLEDLVSDSHAVLVMTIKPLNTVTNFPESAKRLIADTQTVKMTLGMSIGFRIAFRMLGPPRYGEIFLCTLTTYLGQAI